MGTRVALVTGGSSSKPGYWLTSGPDVVANAVTKAATARCPRTRYQVGIGAKPMIWLSWLLPNRAFDALIKRGSGVPVWPPAHPTPHAEQPERPPRELKQDGSWPRTPPTPTDPENVREKNPYLGCYGSGCRSVHV